MRALSTMALPYLKSFAPCLQTQTWQSRQPQQKPGRFTSQSISEVAATLPPASQIAGQKLLQLVQIRIRESGHLQRSGVVVASLLGGTHVDLVGKGQGSAQGVERGIATFLPGSTGERQQCVLIQQRLVLYQHIPLCLTRKDVEPPVARAPYFHPIVQPDRKPR